MSSVKWCPEIVLCNSSNEKERDIRIKTRERKQVGGGRPQMHKEHALVGKERLAKRQWKQDLELFLFLSWASGHVAFSMQGPYFHIFVFLALVAARLIKVHKQYEMCSLMSKRFCKKGSVLGKLAMSAKTVSKASLMHLRTNNQAILTRLVCLLSSPHSHCSLIFCTLLPMEIIVRFTSWQGGQSHIS